MKQGIHKVPGLGYLFAKKATLALIVKPTAQIHGVLVETI